MEKPLLPGAKVISCPKRNFVFIFTNEVGAIHESPRQLFIISPFKITFSTLLLPYA